MADREFVRAASRLVPENYLKQAVDAGQAHRRNLHALLQQGKLPRVGWSEADIEQLLTELARLDSNNFPHHVGVGEREARIYSELVRRRHHGMGHGVGRSGDLTACQPKATGSSLLYQLTARLALDVVKISGVPRAAAAVVVPAATGVALLVCLASLAEAQPESDTVLWCRCDQRSAPKAILTAGLRVVVVEGMVVGDEVVTDMGALKEALEKSGVARVRAVVTTTSCFAPRACDNVEEVARLCAARGVPHVINNAYGVQSTKLMHRIKEAARVGRVDCVVQSTDKNFMVPVGGSIVFTFNKITAKRVGEAYPGRASISPVTDLLITLLSLGSSGYLQLTRSRNDVKRHLDDSLRRVAATHGLRLLHTPGNPISAGLALPLGLSTVAATALGSMLFTRGVSGARVVAVEGKPAVTVASATLAGWGSHYHQYPVAYLTAAATIGMTHDDVNTFCNRLHHCLLAWRKRNDVPAAPIVNKTIGDKIEATVSNVSTVNSIVTDSNTDETVNSAPATESAEVSANCDAADKSEPVINSAAADNVDVSVNNITAVNSISTDNNSSITVINAPSPDNAEGTVKDSNAISSISTANNSGTTVSSAAVANAETTVNSSTAATIKATVNSSAAANTEATVRSVVPVDNIEATVNSAATDNAKATVNSSTAANTKATLHSVVPVDNIEATVNSAATDNTKATVNIESTVDGAVIANYLETSVGSAAAVNEDTVCSDGAVTDNNEATVNSTAAVNTEATDGSTVAASDNAIDDF